MAGLVPVVFIPTQSHMSFVASLEFSKELGDSWEEMLPTLKAKSNKKAYMVEVICHVAA